MKFNIYAKEITVTESMREHLEKKLSKVNKIFDENRFISMDVRILKERGQYKLELTAHLSGIVVRVEEKGTDFYLAVDKLADIFEKRLKRFKERKSIKHKLSVREISDSISVSEYAEEEGSMITRRKRFSIKPMTLEEALLQMEMLGHTFFVFRNAESGEVNVLYARKNGSVGLIEMSE
ncbi:MAG: ribosome-associated translation inhibitor RaiA [Thermotogae bacterium]|uniref:Ribosome hibernation promoting factor n=1 Tax=Kosmotoga arenicorallina TaxID=688066 RepID=A0A7C5DVI5_9BACT|nr:ribosome-associated translation inhibitor RaiA [Kosmotoga sp.]MBO8167394.1 ribosome-associated translation inhibitor RaiA [Kosmotoga sp.]MCD6159144.1 ribosome-associated translation inhibitor RaiA [Kosmotoga sp.]RKX48947.1 MAG: ribosome-associated translation inhibitor RaiA [Thermotogota bacterium]HHF08885.1 ribosome-associated translation inhibitor RaiA [Kosmotoga arenicorallina]